MAGKFDIHFQLWSEGEGAGNGKLFTFGFTSAVGVKGPQKLINRWVKCLFTTKGSDPLRPAEGTGFPGLIGSNFGNAQDVQDAATMFMDDCSSQIRLMDRFNGAADNERLASATIYSITPRGPDGFDIVVHIRNVAGEALTFLLPSV